LISVFNRDDFSF